MFNIKIDIPRDFEGQIKRQLAEKLKESLWRNGVMNVAVEITIDGQAKFSGSDDDLKKVQTLLDESRL